MDSRTLKPLTWVFFLGLISACGGAQSTERSSSQTNSPRSTAGIKKTFLEDTGGSASSQDGLFSIQVQPTTFDTSVSISIEQITEEVPEENSLSKTYRVRYLPSDLEVNAEAPLQVEYKVTEEIVFDIGAENLRMAYREFEQGLFQHYLAVEVTPGNTATTTTVLDADFGLVYVTQSTTETPDSPPPGESEDSECNDAEFKCTTSQICIPLLYTCNGTQECEDGSDEAEALCASSEPVDTIEGDQFEPDNSFSQTSEIASGETQERSLTLYDTDFLRFELTEPRNVTVAANSEFAGDGIVVQLYDADHNQIEQSSEISWGYENQAIVRVGLQPGVYFIGLSPLFGHEYFTYSLFFQTDEIVADPPQNVNVNYLGTRIEISWDAVEGAEGYNVHYGELSGVYTATNWFTALEGISPIYSDTNSAIISGLPFYYSAYLSVSAVVGGVETLHSDEVVVELSPMADEFEPDGSFALATPMHDEAITSGVYINLHNANESGDYDYVVFELEGYNNTITLETTGKTWTNTYLELFDSSQVLLASNDDQPGNIKLSKIVMENLAPGTYYGLARPKYEYSTYGTYGIQLTVEANVTPDIAPDAFETNDNINDVQTSDIHKLIHGAEQNRTIHAADDFDFAWFQITSPGDVVIETEGSEGATELSVYDSEQNLIDTDATPNSFSELTLSNLEVGIYLVQIEGQDENPFVNEYVLKFSHYPAPGVPQNVILTEGSGFLQITWDSVENATEYLIYYQNESDSIGSTAQANEGVSPLSLTENQIQLTGLPTDSITTICIKAVNETAQGDCSISVSGTPGE